MLNYLFGFSMGVLWMGLLWLSVSKKQAKRRQVEQFGRCYECNRKAIDKLWAYRGTAQKSNQRVM